MAGTHRHQRAVLMVIPGSLCVVLAPLPQVAMAVRELVAQDVLDVQRLWNKFDLINIIGR